MEVNVNVSFKENVNNMQKLLKIFTGKFLTQVFHPIFSTFLYFAKIGSQKLWHKNFALDILSLKFEPYV